MANSTYDNILKEGEKIGLEKGKEIVITNIIQKYPELKDNDIAKLAEVTIQQVQTIRTKLSKK